MLDVAVTRRHGTAVPIDPGQSLGVRWAVSTQSFGTSRAARFGGIAVRRSWAAVAIVALAALAPVIWTGLLRGTSVADGTVTFPTSPPWSDAGVTVTEVIGQPGDLRAGDRVVAVAGVPLERWVTDPPAAAWAVGESVTYDVIRDGRPVVISVVLVDYPFAEKIRAHASSVPLIVLMLVVAAFVFLSRPADRAARTLFALAALIPLTATAWPLGPQVIDLVAGLRVWPFVLGDAVTGLVWATLLYFALVFPERHGIFARSRVAVAAVFALPFVLHAVYVAVALPGAVGALGRLGRIIPVSVQSARVVPVLVAAALIWQYTLARDRDARVRLRWVFATVGVITVLYLGLGQLPDWLLGHPLVPWDWVPVFFAPFPVVLAAAVLRYRLFDIQIILRRSLVLGAATVLLAGLYLAVVGLVGALSEVALSDAASRLGPLLATAVVALSFQPLRSWLRRNVSRLMFGERDDPYEVLSRLGHRLESTASADSVLEATVITLAQTLRLHHVGIELLRGDELVVAAAIGTPSGAAVRVPLIHHGEEVGGLVLDAGPAREPFGPSDRGLLESLARQIAVTASNVELGERLRRSLERVVSAREEERRRLRRDIHDGLGPVLASGAMRLDVARRVLRTDPDRADAILADLAEHQRSLIIDVRRLVDALRPPVLDQLGLAAAVRQRAAQLSPEGRPEITVEAADGIGPLPAAVEVAAYHVVAEALTNVVRHAGARTCTVRLWRDGALLLEVRDDGRGLPDTYRAGVGLSSIRERAGQLGGSATITAAADGGTLVRARFPLS
jgi:signal transduction histidine kinase